MSTKSCSRRKFIQNVAVAVPAGAALFGSGHLYADELPRVSEDDPVAKALFYVHSVADVDASNPATSRYEPGQTCANCVQIQGPEGDQWRPCGLFPGKSVNVDGWCNVWALKP